MVKGVIDCVIVYELALDLVLETCVHLCEKIIMQSHIFV